MSSRSIGVTNVLLGCWNMSWGIRSPSCSQTRMSRASSARSGHAARIWSSSSGTGTTFAAASSKRSKNSRSRGTNTWDRRAMPPGYVKTLLNPHLKGSSLSLPYGRERLDPVYLHFFSGAPGDAGRRRDRLPIALQLVGIDRVGVLRGGEAARPDLVGVGPHARHHVLLDVGKALGEARAHAVVDAQQVVEDQDLAVGRRAGADADDRNLHALHDRLGHRGGDRLEHDREAAGVLEVEGVAVHAERTASRAALRLVAAERGGGLRGEADVPHHGDAGVDDRPGPLHGDAAALELDRVAARLLDEALGGGDRLLVGGLVGAEGHVADQERRLQATPDRASQDEHLVQ